MNPIPNSGRLAVAAAGLLTLAATAQAAIAWNEYQVSGFLSQGFLYTTANDYPTPDSSDGDFDFREYGVNVSRRFGANWRVGAQVFGQELGAYGNDDLRLDWGIVDFNLRQEFGIRAGRVKMPRGLYNEGLDLDMARSFIFLPQSVYDARLRDFQASFDGAMVYGNVGLGEAGTLDYRIFYGEMPLDIDSGASDYFNIDAPFANLDIRIESAIGGSLFWNTPVEGLRVGYSFSRFEDFDTVRYIPFRETDIHKTAPDYDRHLLSAEYSAGDWLFAAEAGREYVDYILSYPNGTVYGSLYAKTTYYYVSASRRITDRIEIGGYYSQYHWSQTSVGSPVIFPVLDQTDHALSVRFDLNPHVILKIEGHYMDGAGQVFDVPSYPQPAADRDNSWMLFAAKATVFF